jgi:hypothetical protein
MTILFWRKWSPLEHFHHIALKAQVHQSLDNWVHKAGGVSMKFHWHFEQMYNG